MKRNSLIFLYLLILFSENVFAQSSILKGKAPEYAGREISVYSYSDFISEEKKEVGKIKFQQDGSFSVSVAIPFTSVCFTEFDIYEAMLYVEPGKTYELQFPPCLEKTVAQKRNPFFELLPVWFKITNIDNNDLNLQIKNFETSYRELENKYFNDIYVKSSKTCVELIRNELLKLFAKSDNLFFEDHKRYRLGNLEYALHQGKSEEFLNSYFGKVNANLQLPAYCTLFNQVFNNYFSFLGNSIHGQKVNNLINSADVDGLKEYMVAKYAWNIEICQLIILKSLKDAYYSGQFSKTSVIQSLNKITQGNWNEKYKMIAMNIVNKISYLQPGTIAPNLLLARPNGQKIAVESYKGQFVYLHFTDLQNPVCQQHLDALKPIAEKFKNHLVVITITEGDASEAEMKKWAGIFAGATEESKNIYRVKTFPTSYLISREGRLLVSPALNPMNGFESQFGQVLEKEKIEKLKKKQ